MKAKRANLLKLLKLAAPALGDVGGIEELAQFWFDGDRLLAYNNVLGIDLPFETTFKGGVRGALLLGVLERANSEEVQIEQTKDGSELNVSAGGARLKLATMPIGRIIHDPPKKPKGGVAFGKDVLDAVELAMISVGDSINGADYGGVTFDPGKKTLFFYSTDGRSITEVRLELPNKYKAKKFIAPAAFCQELPHICPDGGSFDLADGGISAWTKEGARLMSRIAESEKPIDFNEVVGREVPEDFDKAAIGIPEELGGALDRGLVIYQGDVQSMRLTIDGKKVSVFARSAFGQINESLEFKGKHAEREVYVDAALLQRALGKVVRMVVTDRALILQSEDKSFLHLISTVEPPAPERKGRAAREQEAEPEKGRRKRSRTAEELDDELPF